MPISRNSKHPIVKVDWIDAETEHGWKSVEDATALDGARCTTVGHLVRKPTKKSPVYIIAATCGIDAGDGSIEFNSIVKIPKAWTTSVKEIIENDSVGRDGVQPPEQNKVV